MNKKQTSENTQSQEAATVITSQLAQDVKHSVLIVSVVLNLVVLTAWIALQVTSQYDTSVATVLFG